MENVHFKNFHFKKGGTLLTLPSVSLKYSLFDILFGKIVLQKLKVENPVLTLKRSDSGRGIWDFSKDGESEKTQEKSVWSKKAEAQALADQYLSHIEVNNLLVLIPRPSDLIKDEFLARVIKIPSKTLQFSGIDILLRKFPSKDLLLIFLK
jgi:uncharacterized protein involved in outer membrane biogenesis